MVQIKVYIDTYQRLSRELVEAIESDDGSMVRALGSDIARVFEDILTHKTHCPDESLATIAFLLDFVDREDRGSPVVRRSKERILEIVRRLAGR